MIVSKYFVAPRPIGVSSNMVNISLSLSFGIFDLEPQSVSRSNITTAIHAANASTEHSQTPGSVSLALSDGFSSEARIEDFFSRKVQIFSSTVAVGGAARFEIFPWHLFIINTAVKKKLDNFNLFRGNLILTFTINGTPFHAAMFLASYSYLNSRNEGAGRTDFNVLINRSQRPHVFLNASTSKGGCLCIPFFHPQNFLAANSNVVNSTLMGRVDIDSLGTVKQLNGGTDAITITVFAHLEDVELSGPTVALSAQSAPSLHSFDLFDIEAQARDEYDTTGLISGPASAVAAIAGSLSEVPYIGPFALATSIGASAIGGIARLFGYSKPPQVGDVSRMRNTPATNLAMCEGTDLSQKLTATGKQELTIDPRTFGMPVEDNLSLCYYTKRESIVRSFKWDPSDAVGDYIFACAVHPMLDEQTTVFTPPTHTIIDQTSLGFASRCFSEWSGSLKFRFQIIASQYHRGKLAIIYDPKGPISTTNPFNVAYNTIIDLAEGRDFTLTFNWQQEVPYKRIKNSGESTLDSVIPPVVVGGYTPPADISNGCFYVRVVNELVTPDGTTDVDIIMSISAGDDFELVNPSGFNMGVSVFEPQSVCSCVDFSMFDLECQSAVEEVPVEENAPEAETMEVVVTDGVTSAMDQKALMFYGERITSFRQLLKRSCFYRTLSSISTANDIRSVLYTLKAMPLTQGYDPNGVDTANGGTPYNYVNYTYITYLKHAFAGWRGSIRWKFFPATNTSKVSVQRQTGTERLTASTYAPFASSTWNSFITNNALTRDELRYYANTGAGEAITQARTMDSLEVEIPYHIPYKFSRTTDGFQVLNANSSANVYPGGDSFLLMVRSREDTSACVVDAYVSAGEDFALTGFVGAPRVYQAPLPPV